MCSRTVIAAMLALAGACARSAPPQTEFISAVTGTVLVTGIFTNRRDPEDSTWIRIVVPPSAGRLFDRLRKRHVILTKAQITDPGGQRFDLEGVQLLAVKIGHPFAGEEAAVVTIGFRKLSYQCSPPTCLAQ